MKTAIIGLFSGVLLGALSANAQEVLQVKFVAHCETTNGAGKLVKQTINNKTILKDYAEQNSVTNLKSIALVYEVNGDERGDVIEIVDAHTGAVLMDVYGLFFATDLPSNDGTQLSRFAYMYNSQQSISMGSAMLKEKLTDQHGNAKRKITGNTQFYLTPSGSDGLRMCTGTIEASKTFTLTTNAPPATNSVLVTNSR